MKARPIVSSPPRVAGSPWRINLTYWWRHGRLPDLRSPDLFTELVQARKRAAPEPAMAMLADKLAAKRFAADRLGAAWIIPTLWHGTDLPPAPLWPAPFVVKARHGCNQNVFVFDAAHDWAATRRRAARWMKRRYGYWLDEDLYRDIPRGLLVEPFMGTAPTLPVDYKIYVFGGRAEFVQVHLGRGSRHRWILLDRAWRRVSARTADPDPPAPVSLHRMLEAAETLAAGFDFVRVDLYEVAARPLFGEMTFYPGSGLDRFDPVSLDTLLGERWLRARSGPGIAEPVELIAA